MLKGIGERTPFVKPPFFIGVVFYVSKICVSFASLDVICNEFSVCIKFINKFTYIHNAKCLAHVKCYSDCGGVLLLKYVTMVLFVLCYTVSVELLL